ncbi:enoyl-CoA hydratase/isomerase family protein [Rhodohalobacter sp. 614A]|uniref:enoyl-CoA hydratase/isomerase family protein n=1 Tax=Rhodohalobacter sp. 614A TaxID=2908649 RepID=UPI001F178E64|nr:enoyl-CoA hydratase/isomerase family protein [Rhodohalobacter sp. 614A]
MTNSGNGYVTYTTNNNIGTIEFYHPKGNSLPGNILRQLADAITKAGLDDKSNVLVIKSGGEGAFCAGASFDEMKKISTEQEGKDFFMGFANVINAMRTCPKIIICRVHGKTVGGGIGIVAASDFSIAHTKASVRLSEISLGIGPFVVGPAVGRKLGKAAFSTLAFDAKNWYDSEWALHNGLYNKVVDTVEDLNSAVDEISSDLASANPDALTQMKDIMWQSTGHWGPTLEQRAEISGRLVLSDFTKNYIKSFEEK